MPRDSKVYLEDILGAVAKIRRYTHAMSFDQFQADERTVDAVVRNLEIVGEAVKHLGNELRAQAPEIEWRKIASLRDVLIHEYFGVDHEVVWDIIEHKLDPLEEAVRTLAADR
jgi:uncharacterized protein with HEPN domain